MKDSPHAQSVRHRLLNLSRERGEDFQLTLVQFAIERLLYRLGTAPGGERFLLKGAMLFALWSGQAHRPTRDLDLAGRGDPSPDGLVTFFRTLCTVTVPDDGVHFDAESVQVAGIREQQAYQGRECGCWPIWAAPASSCRWTLALAIRSATTRRSNASPHAASAPGEEVAPILWQCHPQPHAPGPERRGYRGRDITAPFCACGRGCKCDAGDPCQRAGWGAGWRGTHGQRECTHRESDGDPSCAGCGMDKKRGEHHPHVGQSPPPGPEPGRGGDDGPPGMRRPCGQRSQVEGEIFGSRPFGFTIPHKNRD